MAEDSTTRFSLRVKNYIKYRPGYPSGVVELLGRGGVVADIGSGTGLLSRPFLDAGCLVIGVEPNREMREAGEAWLAGYQNFRSIDGRAEATGLADGSIDLIVAGQAFHWFDVQATRRECKRILHPGGCIALIWNDRLREGAFMRAIEQVIDRFAQERDPGGIIRAAGRDRIGIFFAPEAFQTAEFPNEQQFDFQGLRGRVLSASYLPNEGEPGCDALTAELSSLFRRFERDGRVTLLYRTQVYWSSNFSSAE